MWLYFPQISMSGLRTSLSRSFRILASPPAAGYKLQHSLSRASPPSVPASHTRAAVQTALDPVSRYRVGRGLFPSQALRHEPVSHPRPPAPQQAASPPDSPRRAVRLAIQHAVGRTASPARHRLFGMWKRNLLGIPLILYLFQDTITSESLSMYGYFCYAYLWCGKVK